MNERPILFSGPMVRAILERRKWQTRRVVADRTSQGNYRASELLLDDPRTFKDCGPSPAGNPGEYLHAYVDALKVEAARGWKRGDCPDDVIERLYPRWMLGDRLWVKEAIRHVGPYVNGCLELEESRYVADDAPTVADAWPWKLKTLPAMFCPKGLSRLTLEVESVRVERLQEITAKDVIAEGAVARPFTDQFGKNPVSAFDGKVYLDLRSLWRSGWDSINAKRGYGWETNPWVWVVEFAEVPQ